MGSDRKICVGMIAGAHGVRGLIRLRSFTEEPEDVLSYGTLTDESGKQEFAVTLKSAAKGEMIVELPDVKSREAAEDLRGTKLYVARTKLPKTRKQEYYASDLVGLAAQDKEGKSFGEILAVHDHGAGTFLEIGKGKSDSFMLPFSNSCVPDVKIDDGLVLIDLPDGWLNKEKPPKEEAEA